MTARSGRRGSSFALAAAASAAVHLAVLAAIIGTRYPPPAEPAPQAEIALVFTAEPSPSVANPSPQPVPAPQPTAATATDDQAPVPPSTPDLHVVKTAIAPTPRLPAPAPVKRTPTPAAQQASVSMPAIAGPPPAAPPSADALATWQQALTAWLDAHHDYPDAARRRGEQGSVAVRFSLTETGEVADASIQHGSGSATLDAATLAMLQGAHLPAPPPGTEPARRTINVSIRYQLNR